jgi:hypothetical protein
MEKIEEDLIEKHVQEDEELRKYVEEHKQYKADLDEFHQRLYLTPDEELRKKVLQKKKLLGKERIFALLDKYRQG